VRAQALVREARTRFATLDGLEFAVVSARNRGHSLQVLDEARVSHGVTGAESAGIGLTTRLFRGRH